jgi:hypothetical protein
MTPKFSEVRSEPDDFIRKGTRIRAVWFEAQNPPASLAGMQMKLGVNERDVTGVVTHIRGNHPVTPTRIEIHVRPDEGGPEVILKREWIREILSS